MKFLLVACECVDIFVVVCFVIGSTIFLMTVGLIFLPFLLCFAMVNVLLTEQKFSYLYSSVA
jgi:hypothetical protein